MRARLCWGSLIHERIEFLSRPSWAAMENAGVKIDEHDGEITAV
jgi:hypothetical protein